MLRWPRAPDRPGREVAQALSTQTEVAPTRPPSNPETTPTDPATAPMFLANRGQAPDPRASMRSRRPVVPDRLGVGNTAILHATASALLPATDAAPHLAQRRRAGGFMAWLLLLVQGRQHSAKRQTTASTRRKGRSATTGGRRRPSRPTLQAPAGDLWLMLLAETAPRLPRLRRSATMAAKCSNRAGNQHGGGWRWGCSSSRPWPLPDWRWDGISLGWP